MEVTEEEWVNPNNIQYGVNSSFNTLAFHDAYRRHPLVQVMSPSTWWTANVLSIVFRANISTTKSQIGIIVGVSKF